jgi:hypothetical protein
MSSSDFSKLSGIEANATANSTDSYLLNRSNHSGTQDVSTISGLTKASVGLDNVPNVDTTNASNITTGTIHVDRLPKVAVSKLHIVPDQVALFALTINDVQNGDTVKQTDTGILYYVKDDTNLDNINGYENYKASIDYSSVTNIPDNIAQVAGLSLTNDSIIQVKSGSLVLSTLSTIKSDLNLNSVDNTSDLDKPISTATQSALDNKLDNTHAGSGDSSHALANGTTAGFMSSSDFSKLSDIEANANNYTHPNHSGDVSSTGDGATTINNNVVSNAKLAQMTTFGLKGRNINSSGNVLDLSVLEVLKLLNGYHKHYYTDFDNGITGTKFTSTVSGTGAANTASTLGFSNAAGVIQLSTGTTTTGRANISDTNVIRFGMGELNVKFRIQIPALSAAAQEFKLWIGFLNSVTNAETIDGAYFEYDRTVSNNWRVKTALNSTRTTVTTGTVVSASTTTFTTLEIKGNANGTQVDFYIDNNLVGSSTTNIPTLSTDYFFIGASIIKTAGTTARTLLIDKEFDSLIYSTPGSDWSV